MCVGCTGPNPAYETYSIDSDALDAPGARDAGPAPDRAVDRAPDGPAVTADGPAGASVDASAPNPRLLGYWKFDEQPGATTAADSSGNGNDGILESLDSSQVWVRGHSGNAIEFPASPIRARASASR